MDEKKYIRAVRNPRHIPGIFNYCDRWCERCPFTLRCSVFAVGKEVDGDRRDVVPDGADLFLRLETARPQADAWMKEHAGHPGVGAAAAPRFTTRDRPIDAHRVGAAAKRYLEFAHAFLEAQADALSKRPPQSEVHPVSAAEAVDLIGWYHTLIAVKLSRAMPVRDDDFDDDPDLADMPRDQDGSAKIALIAIDRSWLAWAVLRLHDAALDQTALSAMATLHRLKIAAEKTFPNAYRFVRPGFDTHQFPGRKKRTPPPAP